MTAEETIPGTSDGLICAYLFDGHGGARPLGWDDLDIAHDGVVWAHLDFSHPKGRQWVQQRGELEAHVIEALLSDESRPRSLEYEGGILTVLRGVNTNPGQEVDDMVSVRIWMEKDRIISTRRRRLISVVDIQTALEEGKGPTSPGTFLVHLADRLSDRIGDAVESIEVSIDQAEDATAAGTSLASRAVLSAIRRKTARIRRYLAPQRDALDRLSRSRSELLSAEQVAMLQELSSRMTNYIDEMDLARERAMVLQEEALSVLAAEQNARMLVLSIVAAVFLPLAFFTGLMGMNVAGLPGLEDQRAFWIVLGMMFAAAGGILGYFKFRKWL